jgi:hypothetical protein
MVLPCLKADCRGDEQTQYCDYPHCVLSQRSALRARRKLLPRDITSIAASGTTAMFGRAQFANLTDEMANVRRDGEIQLGQCRNGNEAIMMRQKFTSVTV